MPLGISFGQKLQPEVIVKSQVEQRAVHVEQYGIDGFPGRQNGDGGGCGCQGCAQAYSRASSGNGGRMIGSDSRGFTGNGTRLGRSGTAASGRRGRLVLTGQLGRS